MRKKIPDSSTLICIDYYNTDKQNLGKKIGNVDRKIPDSRLVSAIVPKTRISEVENKISDVSGLVKKRDYDSKMSDIETKYVTTSDYT